MPARRRESGEKTKGELARERLLDAGDRLFSRRPFDKVSIDDISQEAGVAHGLLFHYFKSKEHLYAEVSRRASEQLEAIHRAPRPEKTADEKLAMSLSLHLDFIKQRRAGHIFVVHGTTSARVRRIWEESRRRFVMTVLSDFYGITAPSAHLVSAVRAWLGFFDELTVAWLEDQKIERTGLVRLCVELFNDVLRRAPLLQ